MSKDILQIGPLFGGKTIAGLLFDEQGRKWTTSHAAKGSRRYRYYVSPTLGLNSKRENLPAGQLESAVVNALVSFLKDRGKIIELAKQIDTQIDIASLCKRAAETAEWLKSFDSAKTRECLETIVRRVVLSKEGLLVEISSEGLLLLLEDRPQAKQVRSTSNKNRAFNEVIYTLQVPLKTKRTLVRTQPDELESVPILDTSLLQVVARAASWFDDLKRSKAVDFQGIAVREGMTANSVAKIVRLAFLHPIIVEAIIEGSVFTHASARSIVRTGDLPAVWDDQGNLFGR